MTTRRAIKLNTTIAAEISPRVLRSLGDRLMRASIPQSNYLAIDIIRSLMRKHVETESVTLVDWALVWLLKQGPDRMVDNAWRDLVVPPYKPPRLTKELRTNHPAMAAYLDIAKFAASHINTADHYFPADAEDGTFFRQGDVYVFWTTTADWLYCRNKSIQVLQLVPGNTQGSRHCLDSNEGVEAYQLETNNRGGYTLGGYRLTTTQPRCIVHPEHATLHLPPSVRGDVVGYYYITYQRDFATGLRVMD